MNFDFSGLKQGLAKMDLGKDQAGMVYNVPLDNIRPNPDQPRKEFDDEGLLRLAEDMKRNGLIQPVVIRADKENPGKFILVTGERRYRAAKLNGDKSIKAILDESWKDDEIGYVQMAENLQRADLKFWELADFIIRHADAGEKQSDIAKKLGIDKRRVSLYMKWKDVPDYIRENKNKIKAIATAVDLAQLPEDEVRKLFDETPEGEFVSRAQASKALKPEEPAPAPDSGSSSGTEAAPEAPSASDSGAEGPAEESFTAPEDTSSDSESGSESGDSAGDSFSFSDGGSRTGSEASESSGDSSFSGSDTSSGSFEESGSFTEESGSETGSFSESGSAESEADSGSESGDSFSFNEGSSGDSGSGASEASGESEVSGSGDSSSLAFDLSEPAADEFKKPIIYGSVDGREAELLWKKKPQTDGWVVVKYEDGTTEEVLAERYKLNRIYEIS